MQCHNHLEWTMVTFHWLCCASMKAVCIQWLNSHQYNFQVGDRNKWNRLSYSIVLYIVWMIYNALDVEFKLYVFRMNWHGLSECIMILLCLHSHLDGLLFWIFLYFPCVSFRPLFRVAIGLNIMVVCVPNSPLWIVIRFFWCYSYVLHLGRFW